MNTTELLDRVFTGGDNVICFAGLEDLNEFDEDNGITRVVTRGYPKDYMVLGSSALSYCVDTDRESDSIMVHFSEKVNHIDFGYDIDTIEKALSIFELMSVDRDNIMFRFPDKNAPLIMTIGFGSWCILVCSSDIIKGESP